MKQLKDLLLLNFSTSDIEAVPELVGTLRKVCMGIALTYSSHAPSSSPYRSVVSMAVIG